MADSIKFDDLNKKRQGTMFTNIQRLVGANNPQNLTSTVSGGVQNRAGQFQGNLATSQNKFSQELEKNRLDTEANKQARAAGISNPLTAISSTPEAQKAQQQQFAKFRAGQYAGPTAIANAGELKQQALGAEQLGRATSTGGGRQSLVQSFINSPRYSQGQQQLDAFLLGRSGPDLKNIRAITAGLNKQAEQANRIAQMRGQMAVEGAKKFGQETVSQLTSAQEAEDKAANQLFQQRVSEQQALNEELEQTRQQLLQAQLQKDAMQRLGLQQLADVDSIYNVNLGDYLTTNIRDVPQRVEDVIQQDQAAKINALLSLAGQDQRFNLGEVGKFQASDQTFDINRLLQDVDERKRQYEWEKRAEAAYNLIADRAKADWLARQAHEQTAHLGGNYRQQRYNEIMSARPSVSDADYQRALEIAGSNETGNELINRQIAQQAAAKAAALMPGRRIRLID